MRALTDCRSSHRHASMLSSSTSCSVISATTWRRCSSTSHRSPATQSRKPATSCKEPRQGERPRRCAVRTLCERGVRGLRSLEWERRTGHIGFIFRLPSWGERGTLAGVPTPWPNLPSAGSTWMCGYRPRSGQRAPEACHREVRPVGGQYEGCLRNWAPLGDIVADHHRYSITRVGYGG